MKPLPIVIGVDVGTSGVRLSAVDVGGDVLWTRNLSLEDTKPTSEGIHEQIPERWWESICQLSRLFMSERGDNLQLSAICVASTSGTLVPTDRLGEPVRPAILYDDQRANSVTAELALDGPPNAKPWNASFSFSKAIWLRKAEPETWSNVHRLLHPTDWITGKLSGDFCVTDHSNALKLGYEPAEGCWNPAVKKSGIPTSMLPKVVSCGAVVGELCAKGALETGLPVMPIIAGATDGIAGLVASGAKSAADANTTLGTTLVWKVLSARKPLTAQKEIYSHLHPSGLWAPGAASNSGVGSVQLPDGMPSPTKALDEQAAQYLPSATFCYPISGKGERFPFSNRDAEAFTTNDRINDCERYAAQLQAIAFIERWGYEVLENSGVTVGDTVFSTGGAASSDLLCQLRASVLKRRVARCLHSNAAFGASILAAAAVQYGGDVLEAIKQMTQHSTFYSPETEVGSRFDGLYDQFRDECTRRGYA